MRIQIQVLSLVLGLFIVSQASAGIRCGNDLITIGETSFEVEKKLATCGMVVDKALVATHTESKKVAQGVVSEERVVERWYIRVDEKGGGYCYPLTFEGGILTEIGDWRRCD